MAKAPSKSSYKTANPAYAQGMREIRKSNAAGIHQDKRQKRARTRSASVVKAVKDSKNV